MYYLLFCKALYYLSINSIIYKLNILDFNSTILKSCELYLSINLQIDLKI